MIKMVGNKNLCYKRVMKRFFKTLLLVFVCVVSIATLTACTKENAKLIGMPNPWTDCEYNLTQAAKIAGFKFPMKLSNYSVRAMKDMIQITYPLDEFRDLIVRKSTTSINNGDISGDYNEYPIKETVKLDKDVTGYMREYNGSVYVMYFKMGKNYYSLNCAKGMSKHEAIGAYGVIKSVER